MPFELKKTLEDRRGENFTSSYQVHQPPAASCPRHHRVRPLLRAGRGLLPDRRQGGALSRLPLRVRRLRPRPGSSRHRRGAPRRARRRPAQSRPDGLRAPAGHPGRRAGQAIPLRYRAGLLHELGRRGDRERHQVRPRRHEADAHPLLRPRLPRLDHRGPRPQRRPRVPHRLRPAAAGGGHDPLRRHRRAGSRAARRRRRRVGDRAHPGQGREHGARGVLARGAGPLPQAQGPDGPRRGAGRHGPQRHVLLSRAVRHHPRHHHGLQGALGGLRPRRRDALPRPRCPTPCSAPWSAPSCTRRPSARTSWPWSPVWPPSPPSTTRTSSTGSSAPARRSTRRCARWSTVTSSSTRSAAWGS